ncbi:transducin family protein/WD-40 repeat family protein [Abeliophyllum distichum]|uniref:Transducin family protein/WD-40 repeat family protein n=1 Tax=Abeliophyllum distichum TaxID=126358 RepID=A0ABD1U3V5_9LAMI
MWDLEGKEMQCWKGQRAIRMSDLGISSDGERLITVCKEAVILIFGLETKSDNFIVEDQTIISFASSKDMKLLLVSLMNEELHLWNIDGSVNLIAKYKGHKRSRFVVRSCFGGIEQAFIASGSEDSQPHRVSGELVLTLPRHSRVVNCVTWNPTNPHMLASASDDRTIRIWGLNQVHVNHNGTLIMVLTAAMGQLEVRTEKHNSFDHRRIYDMARTRVRPCWNFAKLLVRKHV